MQKKRPSLLGRKQPTRRESKKPTDLEAGGARAIAEDGIVEEEMVVNRADRYAAWVTSARAGPELRRVLARCWTHAERCWTHAERCVASHWAVLTLH
eukprot:7186213-Prymnesium_polylepis.2